MNRSFSSSLSKQSWCKWAILSHSTCLFETKEKQLTNRDECLKYKCVQHVFEGGKGVEDEVTREAAQGVVPLRFVRPFRATKRSSMHISENKTRAQLCLTLCELRKEERKCFCERRSCRCRLAGVVVWWLYWIQSNLAESWSGETKVEIQQIGPCSTACESVRKNAFQSNLARPCRN